MFTRGLSGPMVHAYNPYPPTMFQREGALRVATVDGITQTWAIAHPVACPDPEGAPFYIQDHVPDSGNHVIRTGVVNLSPARPNVEMDPSDPDTWQRPYRFT